MPFELKRFAEIGLTEEVLRRLVSKHEAERRPRFERLWSYYRNPVRLPGSGVAAGGGAGGDASVGGASVHSSGQSVGLPSRLKRAMSNGSSPEVVIENDIGWRLDAMVDFVFGKPVAIESLSPDVSKRRLIEAALDAAWEGSGGLSLLQDVALMGGVYGFADVAVRVDRVLSGEGSAFAGAAGVRSSDEAIAAAAARTVGGLVKFEPIEPGRGIPLVDPSDYRRLLGYVIRTERRGVVEESGGRSGRAAALGRWLSHGAKPRRLSSSRGEEFVEVLSAGAREVYRDGERVLSEENALGELPVVHVQNLSQPFSYAGLSDVEPLIPLQDELNTRLSDRAHRVTMQSFRMYMAKGIEGMGELSVAPGQVWSTENPDADVKAFGGDVYTPSEDEHITQVREAMDKASGVRRWCWGCSARRSGTCRARTRCA